MKIDLVRPLSILLISIALAGCSNTVIPQATENTPAGTPAISSTSIPESATDISSSFTPDACSSQLIEEEVQKVHNHMREFDDASIIASNLPREQLSDSIANLQRIRREAEDEEIPSCLSDLKNYQVDHMNTVINTLVTFLGGTDRITLEQSITVAREQHDQYTLELARLLGLTVVPATESAASTPEGTGTP